MGIKRYKPITTGLRERVSSDFAEITQTKPEKTLLSSSVKRGKGNGRNSQGRITVRHRGGGCKKFYRIIDFKRDKKDVEAKVVSIEYDPNRTARIALLHYIDGIKRYILAPNGMKVGDRIIAGDITPVKVGNAMPLKNIPVGTIVHCIEMKPGKGAQIARSAGTFAKLDGKEGKYAMLRLPSGEIRMILSECMATVGVIGNSEHSNIVFGNAGKRRHLGYRSSVRGVAMNTHDHPHGGGRGKQKGYKTPVSPTGVPAKGYRTRKPNKVSSHYIIAKRKR